MVKVLDHGELVPVNVMGGDEDVVRAARVSYAAGTKGEEADKKLIRYLLEHKHLSPFEHVVFQFLVKCPIFVARQWFRHRIGTFDEGGQGLVETAGHSINEQSYRYTQAQDEFYLPSELRAQDQKNRQGSKAGEFSDDLLREMADSYRRSHALYEKLLAAGVAREQARLVLPLATYTKFYWTCNARSLMNFLALRLDDHAQAEIREYAKVIAGEFQYRMPWTAEMFFAPQ